MFLIEVHPVMNRKVRRICRQPYPNHPKGCPNFGAKEGCPPQALIFDKVYDLDVPVFAVINSCDMHVHVACMEQRNPDWTDRQLKCVLYWQASARKELERKINEVLKEYPECKGKGYGFEMCPEAMGVNITETLDEVGIELEWPPVIVARQVALLAKPLTVYRKKKKGVKQKWKN